MAEDTEEKAIALVAKAIAETPHQRAMASAIMRHAGNALAKLSSHEDAALRHTSLSRRHFERMSQDQHRGRARR
jgi:hypothetical protein